jgi:hypothetical protein
MLRSKLSTLLTVVALPALWVFVAAVLFGGAAQCRAQTVEPAQAAASAGAVLNIVRNTEWPAAAFAATGSPIVICVLDDAGTEAAEALKRAASGQLFHGRAVEVRRLTSPKPGAPEDDLNELLRQARAAHVLFVRDAASEHVDALLQRLGNADVLTVGDTEAFADRGGMFGLTVRAGRTVIDANPEKIQATQLKVAPQLLQSREADRASTVKAGMVLNFIRYTDWPATAFVAAESPIIIGVLGDGEMADVLRRTVSDQRVRGRAIEVRRLTPRKPAPGKQASPDDELDDLLRQALAAHVLFVCDSERDRLDPILRRLGKADVLTVSDMDAFAERGGMLGLAIRRKKVAVDANPEKIQATQLKVSSQLLRLAQTVRTRGQ